MVQWWKIKGQKYVDVVLDKPVYVVSALHSGKSIGGSNASQSGWLFWLLSNKSKEIECNKIKNETTGEYLKELTSNNKTDYSL